jgi:hypothetical protein
MFSSDGRRVIWWGTYDSDSSLRVWDPASGQSVKRLDLNSRNAFWKLISEDGNTALSVDLKATTLRYHDVTTGKVVREVAEGAYDQPIVLSPAGDKMVAHSGILMSVGDRKKILNVGRVGYPNYSVKFSADGRRLIAAVVHDSEGKDVLCSPPAEEIAAIDVAAAKKLRRFAKRDGKYHEIHAATLSRDGKTVFTTGHSGGKPDEQIITLWEFDTGRERGHFLGHHGSVQSLDVSSDGRVLVSGGDDTTALVWNATRPTTRSPSVRQTSAQADTETHCKYLAGKDTEQAYASIWALSDTPKTTVALLAGQRTLFMPTDVTTIQRWIADLDSNDFAERQRAAEGLGMILDEAEPHLKKALNAHPSAEVRRQVELLLQERNTGFTGRELQRLRVVEVLEHIADGSGDAIRTAAIDLLRKLAAGMPESVPGHEATAALARLEKRNRP